MKYRGIIFDFNGVLWWDTELQEQAWKSFSKNLRGTSLTKAEMKIHVHGRNNKHTLSYLVGHNVNSDELEQLTQEKENIYRELCLAKGKDFKLSPGAKELLSYLVKHSIPNTIATASEKSNLDFFIKYLKLDKWFNVSKIVYDNGKLQGKPAPDIYLKACKNIQLNPKECIVVEDAISGIRAARAARIGKIIALGARYKEPGLKELEGYNNVIENLGEINCNKLFSII
jgi:beta-phosphoglucomutase-like phosphatase (HAD superfamily)